MFDRFVSRLVKADCLRGGAYPVSVGKGDVLVGALGRRDALHGYVGRVPEQLTAGDTMGLEAANARADSERFADLVEQAVFARRST